MIKTFFLTLNCTDFHNPLWVRLDIKLWGECEMGFISFIQYPLEPFHFHPWKCTISCSYHI